MSEPCSFTVQVAFTRAVLGAWRLTEMRSHAVRWYWLKISLAVRASSSFLNFVVGLQG